MKVLQRSTPKVFGEKSVEVALAWGQHLLNEGLTVSNAWGRKSIWSRVASSPDLLKHELVSLILASHHVYAVAELGCGEASQKELTGGYLLGLEKTDMRDVAGQQLEGLAFYSQCMLLDYEAARDNHPPDFDLMLMAFVGGVRLRYLAVPCSAGKKGLYLHYDDINLLFFIGSRATTFVMNELKDSGTTILRAH